MNHGSKAPFELVVAITATFTSEPIQEFLHFWIARLGLGPSRIEFSGYNQVFQELMTPDSLLASDKPGVNCLLIRFEDWARDQAEGLQRSLIERAAQDFVEAMKAFAGRAGRPTFVLFCPPSTCAASHPELANCLERLQ